MIFDKSSEVLYKNILQSRTVKMVKNIPGVKSIPFAAGELIFDRPSKIIMELTNKCNLRCKMCGIWAEPQKKVFSLELYKDILKSRTAKFVKHISLTGGEPFLISNLEDYYFATKELKPNASINISTNGFLTEKILKFLGVVDDKQTSITISYDGIKSHNSIRRVNGSAERLLDTAVKIKEHFPNIVLSLKLTITPENYNEILDTAKQCKQLGVPFRFKTMEKINCNHNRYPSDIDEPDYSDKIIDSIANQSRELLNLGIETNRKYIITLLKKYSGKSVKCNCSPRNLFIGIDGKLFLCRKKEPIGDLNHQTFEEIWNSDKKKAVTREMKTCQDNTQSLTYINN